MDPGGAGFTIMIIAIVVVSTIVPLGLVGLFLYKFFKRQHESQLLLRTGEAAQAQIISLQQTGTYINNQPEVLIGLNVQRQGQAPYQAQARMVVGMIHMPRVQPGMMVTCKVDPNDPAKVAIDLSVVSNPGMGMGMGMGMPQQQQAQYGMGGMAGAAQQFGMGAAQAAQQGMAQMGQAAQTRNCSNCHTPFPATLTNCPSCGAVN